MPCQQFYVFDRQGKLLYFIPLTEKANKTPAPFVSNLCYQLNCTIQQFNQADQLQSFETNQYKCHVFQTMTGFWFIVLTDVTNNTYHSYLEEFYKEVFITYCLNDIEWDVASCEFSETFKQQIYNYWKDK